MLVLSRKVGQSIIIGNNIHVKIVEVRGQQVRLGVEAPESVSIIREEIHSEVADINRQAAEPAGIDIESIARELRDKGGEGR